MAKTVDLFVGSEAPLTEIRDVIEAAVGEAFGTNRNGQPVVPVGTTSIYLADTHHFDDEDVQWPDGSWIKLESDYPNWIQVRDRDLDHQLGVAQKVYRALKEIGRWRVVLINDMQRVIDQYAPPCH